jgi:hypothetical protein
MMVPQLAVLVEPLKLTAVPWMCEDAAAGALITAVGFKLQAEAVGALSWSKKIPVRISQDVCLLPT